MNVKECKQNMTAAYFMKKDPEKPFGRFNLSLIFNEMGENENQYVTNTLEFDEDVQPIEYDIKVPENITDQLVQNQKLNPKKKSEDSHDSANQQKDHDV